MWRSEKHSYRIQILFQYFHRFIHFCGAQGMGTEELLSMCMADSHTMHWAVDVNLAELYNGHILTHVRKQLIPAVFFLMLISG